MAILRSISLFSTYECHKNVSGECAGIGCGAETDPSVIAGANPDAGTYWQNDNRYFDQYTLQEIPVTLTYGWLKDSKTADKIARMNYDIHVGAVLGLPGKIMAFFASLLAATLPLTGFYIWWGRKYKGKKQQ